MLITKDGDFRDSRFLRGTPKRLLRLVIGNVSNDELNALIESYWPEIATASQQDHCYLELSCGGLCRAPSALLNKVAGCDRPLKPMRREADYLPGDV